MTKIAQLDMEREAKKKQNELDKIKHARELIQSGQLRESSVLLFDMLKATYGEPCVRNWTFRQYACLSKDNSPTELGKVVDEFLKCREEKQAWWS